MLDLFSIFTKGGIVLWYFQGTALSLTPAVNSLIKTVLLQERGGTNTYNYESLKLHFKLDNEFELVFVVVYQRILQLSYVDKLLDQLQLAFRDKYKNELTRGELLPMSYSGFGDVFKDTLSALEQDHRLKMQQRLPMKKFEESRKYEKSAQAQRKSDKKEEALTNGVCEADDSGYDVAGEDEPADGSSGQDSPRPNPRQIIASRMSGKLGKGRGKQSKGRGKGKAPSAAPVKAKKEDRKWDGVVSKKDASGLDYSGGCNGTTAQASTNGTDRKEDSELKGCMIGQLQPLDATSSSSATPANGSGSAKAGGGGVFSFFRSLTAGKTITRESMSSVLEKMKEHLITKNVAAEIADKLCASVAAKLDGKTIGTFSGIQSVVRASMEESLVQILSPKRRIDVLRDALSAREHGRPYVVTFCGVNGVGKSTNLAKICFWLLENGLRVLIAGCDTFRSGAVEQLRTHKSRLAALHPPDREGGPSKVMLYERGYGKDAAGIAMEAINFAHQQKFDVVLVDTAGRMQDNEPLMKALAKLIRVNSPDLVLFVGEALVGNEAVDQLVKFNRALIDHADPGQTQQDARTIDGILLTKFDTIDDKVGAAISMAYTTGQPIVFVGTGQTYRDLKNLNVQTVVATLLQ